MSYPASPPAQKKEEKDEPQEPRLCYYDVICRVCRMGVGYPCMTKRGEATYTMIHIARVLTWEAMHQAEELKKRVVRKE